MQDPVGEQRSDARCAAVQQRAAAARGLDDRAQRHDVPRLHLRQQRRVDAALGDHDSPEEGLVAARRPAAPGERVDPRARLVARRPQPVGARTPRQPTSGPPTPATATARPRTPHQRRPSAGALTIPATASPSSSTPISVAHSGMPRANAPCRRSGPAASGARAACRRRRRRRPPPPARRRRALGGQPGAQHGLDLAVGGGDRRVVGLALDPRRRRGRGGPDGVGLIGQRRQQRLEAQATVHVSPARSTSSSSACRARAVAASCCVSSRPETGRST